MSSREPTALPCPVLHGFVERARIYSIAGKKLAAEMPVPLACPSVRLTRAESLLDWRIRQYGPECLRRTGDAKLIEHAAQLEELDLIRTPNAAADAYAAAAAAAAADAYAADADDDAAYAADSAAYASVYSADDSADADAAAAAADAAAAAAAADDAYAADIRDRAAYWQAFAARLRARGYYGRWVSYRCLRVIAFRAAAKKDETPGLRTRKEFDALLAPHAAAMRESVLRAYWHAVAGPPVIRAAIEAGKAHEFAASLKPIGMEKLVVAPGVSIRELRELERELYGGFSHGE